MRVRVASGAALALLVASAPSLAAGPAPLERARQAAEQNAFEGVLQVRWRDGDVVRSERLTVQAAGGSLMVRGTNQVMARPAFGRLLAHGSGGWEEMWLPSLAPAPRPDGTPKYMTTEAAPGPTVAGRPTKVVEIHHDNRLLERIHLDTATDLLLQRDQYDAQGTVVRTLAFESITVNPSVPPPPAPSDSSNHAPKQISADRARSPETLGEGYQRMGIYRSGSVLQVLYSDGVYDLSLFQQPGKLRNSDLPDAVGDRVDLADTTGFRYPWPGGQVVVWSEGGSVFTAVSDAPPEQVLAAVRSLPRIPTRELSLLGKIRRACQALMEPLS
jgi:hypothetical protein